MVERLEYENIYESIEKDVERAMALLAVSNALIDLDEALTTAGVPKGAVILACRIAYKIARSAI